MSLNGGYAMIKYNSTQEELAVAYKSKRPALFYDENQRAHWAVIEETATKSVDEETQEPITTYEYSYRLIDEASGTSTLEDIVDKNGNKRFIEGNGTPIIRSGLTTTYCKWSLSGTHLMCVIAGNLAIGTSFEREDILASFTVPSYIGSKIFPVYQNNIEFRTVSFYGNDGTTQNVSFNLGCENNTINFTFSSMYTASGQERRFRIQFDLLIDSE